MKAMSKLTIILVILLLALKVQSQDFFDAGLKLGINYSKISAHLEDYDPQTICKYSFGAFTRVNLGRLYFQPEIYYNSKGGEETKKTDSSIVNSFDLKTVDVPALVGLKLVNQRDFNLRILTGPVLSFLTDKSVEGQLTRENLHNSQVGWQYGVGVDLLFVTLDTRMESFQKNFYDGIKSKNGTFVINLGIKLF
jgi:hypothetical protein